MQECALLHHFAWHHISCNNKVLYISWLIYFFVISLVSGNSLYPPVRDLQPFGGSERLLLTLPSGFLSSWNKSKWGHSHWWTASILLNIYGADLCRLHLELPIYNLSPIALNKSTNAADSLWKSKLMKAVIHSWSAIADKMYNACCFERLLLNEKCDCVLY